VLDTLTDLAARYLLLLAQSAANHASLNHNEPELALEISIQDVRMALQDCGALIPEKVLEDQAFDGEEDTRGVDGFLAWAAGPVNREIRRVALDGGDGAKDEYLTGLFYLAARDYFSNSAQFSKRSIVRRTKIRGTMGRS
jgi:transcription initiation factor TFIID subunit 3